MYFWFKKAFNQFISDNAIMIHFSSSHNNYNLLKLNSVSASSRNLLNEQLLVRNHQSRKQHAATWSGFGRWLKCQHLPNT